MDHSRQILGRGNLDSGFGEGARMFWLFSDRKGSGEFFGRSTKSLVSKHSQCLRFVVQCIVGKASALICYCFRDVQETSES